MKIYTLWLLIVLHDIFVVQRDMINYCIEAEKIFLLNVEYIYVFRVENIRQKLSFIQCIRKNGIIP
jgi:hypothetical protein